MGNKCCDIFKQNKVSTSKLVKDSKKSVSFGIITKKTDDMDYYILNATTSTSNNDSTIVNVQPEITSDKMQKITREENIYYEPPARILTINYKKVRTMSKINIKNRVNYFKSIYDNENKRLLVSDPLNSSLSRIDVINSTLRLVNPKNILKKPISLCLNNQSHVVVFDEDIKTLFIFNSLFKRNQEYSSSYRLNFIINEMTVDKETNSLYGCDKTNNRLVLFEAMDNII
jgi:hypothetical protein